MNNLGYQAKKEALPGTDLKTVIQVEHYNLSDIFSN